MHPSRKMVSWISVVSGSAWTHSAATKNQLQQRREFTADLDTKPGDKTIDGAASLVRKTCEKMTSWKLETSIQTVPFQFISTLICLIMFDIQGGDILEDTYQTREEIVLYIHIYIYQLAMKFKQKRYNYILQIITHFYCKVQILNVSNFTRFHLPMFLRKSFIPVAYELGDDGRVPGSNFENRQREMVSSLMQVFLEEPILRTSGRRKKPRHKKSMEQ